MVTSNTIKVFAQNQLAFVDKKKNNLHLQAVKAHMNRAISEFEDQISNSPDPMTVIKGRKIQLGTERTNLILYQ